MDPLPIQLVQEDGFSLIVKRALESEAEEIVTFQEEHYYQKSPLRQVIGYDCPPQLDESLRKAHLHRTRHRLRQSCSLTVRDPVGRLVAVVVNEIEHSSPTLDDIQKGKIDVMEALNKDVDLFDLYSTDCILHLWQLAVRVEHAHRGLAVKLVQLTIELAKATSGVHAIKVEVFNQQAFRVLSSLGFDIINSIEYSSYQPSSRNGSLLLAGRGAASLMACRLNIVPPHQVANSNEMKNNT